MRVTGSGAQSDTELRGFLKSLPSIGNTPEGNEIIAKTVQGFANNKVRAAEIAFAILDDKITREHGEKLMRELPDPMEEYRAYVKAQKKVSGGDPEWQTINGVRVRAK
jgi:hypothetical protein